MVKYNSFIKAPIQLERRMQFSATVALMSNQGLTALLENNVLKCETKKSVANIHSAYILMSPSSQK